MSGENPTVSNSSLWHRSGGSRSSNNHHNGHDPMVDEAEKVERMAERMIEQAMTYVVVRVCWCCQRRFVKTDGCAEVVCVCGNITCHRCGGRVDPGRHICRARLPHPTLYSIRRAALATKRHLRSRYPNIRFKYDPSRPVCRQYRNRMRRQRRYRGFRE